MGRRSAECGVEGRVNLGRRSDRFLAGLVDFDSVIFVSHVHPDPDSLGSMLGLAHLVETCLGKSTRLTRDGPISRAENQAMVEFLPIELEPIEEAAWDESSAVVMVDSQPNTGRHSFDSNGEQPLYAVIDHHDTPGDLEGIPFVDVRRSLGATCSLVTSYLVEQDLTIPPRLATGLLYGIETELSGYPREASALDDTALQILYPLANKDLLAKIRNARLPQSYFECLLQALQSSFIYDRLIISWVHELPQPELAAEVVDFLIRFEEVDWAVCAGVCQDQLILSVRAAVRGGRAGEMLRQVVGKLGIPGARAGGHDRRAGGAVPLTSTASSAIEQVQSELRRRLLKALHIDECRGQRLVSRRDMLQNLQA
jgi:nanoRNase/pAp phosphatase (c-di-AMP/oligoRNAs hydrolase)